MIKLLRACVRRYTHNTIFWIAAVLTIGLGISIAHSARMTYYDDALVIAQMLIHAIMISWVVGKEFKEGIFRNKVIVGHSKGRIFLAELISGVDKPVRDRMKGLIHGVKDYLPDDTLRNFCHCGAINVGSGKLIVCTFNTASVKKPAGANFFAALLNNAAALKAENSIEVKVLEEYLANAPLVVEDVMNHFWEIDNKPVEDTLFWEETGINLRKLK